LIRLAMRRLAIVAVVALAVLALPTQVWAESTLVILVRPTSGGAGAAEVLHRAHGELVADGFTVLLTDAPPHVDPITLLGGQGRASGAPVTAGLFVADDATSIDLYLVDALSSRTLTRHLEVPANAADQGPEVLARRAVDVLRASLLDFLVASLRSAVSRAHPAPVAAQVDQPTWSRWAIEAGLCVLGSLQGVGPAVVPLARVRYAVTPTLQLRVTGAWLGTQPRIDAAAGSATVEQGTVLAEAIGTLWRDRWIHPHLSFGTGAYYVGVTGSGASPYSGSRSTEVALALDAGAGVAASLGSNLEVGFEVHALMTAPGIAIRFLDTDVARVGRPSLLGALTLAGWI
jgi:hypothetical protein